MLSLPLSPPTRSATSRTRSRRSAASTSGSRAASGGHRRRWREREWSAWRRKSTRVAATLVITGGSVAYILSRIDLGETLDILRNAELGYLVGAIAIMTVTVLPMAWRWQRLLAARGIADNLPWLTRAYFVGYTAGQVLPTAVGGDAARIFETSRRHPGKGGPVAGSVLLERA